MFYYNTVVNYYDRSIFSMVGSFGKGSYDNTRDSKKGSGKVLGRVLGKRSQKGSFRARLNRG